MEARGSGSRLLEINRAIDCDGVYEAVLTPFAVLIPAVMLLLLNLCCFWPSSGRAHPCAHPWDVRPCAFPS